MRSWKLAWPLRPARLVKAISLGMVSMLSYLARVLLVILLAVTAAGCSVVGGIFKAGFWVGIVIAAVIVVGVVALLRR